jgi:M6 family metalloprotease-like protein
MRRALVLVILVVLAAPLGMLSPASSGTITCFDKKPTIKGTSKSDVLRGTAGPDVIAGRGARDIIKGLGGRDLLCGDGGNDQLVGGPGRDQLDGGAGQDDCLSGETIRSCEPGGSPGGGTIPTQCPTELLPERLVREPLIEVRLSEAKTIPQNHLSGVGEMKVAMIFVDFPDFPASESTQDLYEFHAPPAENFWTESSQGRMSMTVTPFHKWYRMPLPSTEYPAGLSPRGGFSTEKRQLMRDAIKAADPEVDLSPFDSVAIVASEGAASGGSGVILAVLGEGLGITADGNELRFTQMIASVPDGAGGYRRNSPEASLVHDTAHWLGMTDTYTFTSDGVDFSHVGRWDLTSLVENPHSFMAWHQWKIGWLGSSDFECLNEPGTMDVTLSPLGQAGGVKAAVVPIAQSEAYVAEVRENVGLDAHACDHGVLIYKVNAAVGNAEGTIDVQTSAVEDPTLADINRCGPKYNAPYGLEEGEASVFEDTERGVHIEVLEKVGLNYRIRVSYTGPQVLIPAEPAVLLSGPQISELGVSPQPFDPDSGPMTITYRVSEPPNNTDEFEGGPDVDITIYNAAGQRVRSLQELLHVPWGRHTAQWDGRDDDGALVPPGDYYFDVDAFGLRRGRSAIKAFSVS